MAQSLLDQEYADIQKLPAGSKAISRFTIGHRLAENSKAAALLKVKGSVDETMKSKQLQSDTLDRLEWDDPNKGTFKANDFWQVNDKGEPFVATIPNPDPKIGPRLLTKAEEKAMIGTEDGLSIKYKTLNKREAQLAKSGWDKWNEFRSGVADAPTPDAVGEVVKEQTTHKYTIGKQYKDSQGRSATYTGNGDPSNPADPANWQQ